MLTSFMPNKKTVIPTITTIVAAGFVAYIRTLFSKGTKEADKLADSYEDKVQAFTDVAIGLLFDRGEDLLKASTIDEMDPIITKILAVLEEKTQEYSDEAVSLIFDMVTTAIKDATADLINAQKSDEVTGVTEKLKSRIKDEIEPAVRKEEEQKIAEKLKYEEEQQTASDDDVEPSSEETSSSESSIEDLTLNGEAEELM